jgi:hypothetical protein
LSMPSFDITFFILAIVAISALVWWATLPGLIERDPEEAVRKVLWPTGLTTGFRLFPWPIWSIPILLLLGFFGFGPAKDTFSLPTGQISSMILGMVVIGGYRFFIGQRK